MILNMEPGLFPKDEAERVARELATGEDEWTYHVEPAGDDLYRIRVVDEDGELVAYVSGILR